MTITEARTRRPARHCGGRRRPQIQLRKLLVEARGIHKVADGSRSQTALHTQWLRDSLSHNDSRQITGGTLTSEAAAA